ncbi:MAG: ribosomal protein S18-alanine N-acetyltransferase [Acidimicrobiia bacterium]
MRRSDLAAAMKIERAVYPEPWPERVFSEELGGADRSYIVAEDASQLVGYAGFVKLGEDAHVTTITVTADRHSEGIGTELMLALVDEALAHGAENLTLEVRVSNDRAQALYRRFGLAPVGIRRQYYRSEDALVMWAEGIDQPSYRERLQRIREGAA